MELTFTDTALPKQSYFIYEKRRRMPQAAWNLLLIDDDEDNYLLTRDMLTSIQRSIHLQWATSLADGKEKMHSGAYDALLVDYFLGGETGIELIHAARAEGLSLPILLLTGQGSYALDVEAMRAGASDYLAKSELTPTLLERTLRYAIQSRRRQDRLANLARASTQLMTATTLPELLPLLAECARPVLDAPIALVIFPDENDQTHFFASPTLETSPAASLLRQLAADVGGLRSIFAENANVTLTAAQLKDILTWWTTPIESRALNGLLGARLIDETGEYRGLLLAAKQDEGFNEEDQTLLNQLAATASLCIQHIRAHQMAEQAAQDAYEAAESAWHTTAQLETMLQALPMGVWIAGADGKVIRQNPRAAQISQQMENIYFFGSSVPITFEEWPLSQTLRTGERQENVGLEVHGEEGNNHYLLLSTAAVFNEEGEVIGAVAAEHDITERRVLEQQLRETQENYRQLLETSFEGVWRVDEETRTEFINERGAAMLGYTPAEMMGHPSLDFLYPDQSPQAQESYEKRKQGVSDYSEWHMRCKDGSECWMLTSSVPLYRADGAFHGALAMFTDVTARHLAEKALRESEERFRIALSNSPISVFTVDRELRYTWLYHPRASGLYENVPMDDLTGLRDDEIGAFDDPTPLMELKREALASGKSIRREMALTFREQPFYLDVTLEPLLNDKGALIGLTGAAMNITDLRRLQAEQVKHDTQTQVSRRLLEQREQERLEIARDLHDGPLQDMIAASFQVASLMSGDETPPVIKTILHSLQANIQSLRLFCNELRPPTLAPFGFERAIRSFLDAYCERYPQIKLHTHLMNDGKILSEDLRLAMYRICQELLNNAARHSQASEVTVSFWFDVGQVILQVEDNGVGFEVPQNWLDLANAGHLGLVGLRERAAAASGELQIDSAPGQGARITLTVPLLD